MNINPINDNALKLKNFKSLKPMNMSFINKTINFNKNIRNKIMNDNENNKEQKINKSKFFLKNLSNSYKNNFKKIKSIRTLANKIKNLKKSCISFPNQSSRNYKNKKGKNKKEISRMISLNGDDCFKSLSRDEKNKSKANYKNINDVKNTYTHIKSIKHFNKMNFNKENISNNQKNMSNEKVSFHIKDDNGSK